MVENRYLILEKKNEVYLSIEAESDIRRELSEFFTFEVPGYKFMPQYRNRYWDGKIRLFKYASGEIYYGLLPYIRKFCEDNNIQIVSKLKEFGALEVTETEGVVEKTTFKIPKELSTLHR